MYKPVDWCKWDLADLNIPPKIIECMSEICIPYLGIAKKNLRLFVSYRDRNQTL